MKNVQCIVNMCGASLPSNAARQVYNAQYSNQSSVIIVLLMIILLFVQWTILQTSIIKTSVHSSKFV